MTLFFLKKRIILRYKVSIFDLKENDDDQNKNNCKIFGKS